MGKVDILMIIAGMIMTVLLGLLAVPSINKSSETPKYAIYNSEILNIRNIAILWVANNKIDGTSTGITTDKLESYSKLTKNASGYLESKVDSASGYTIASIEPNKIEITLRGITLNGAEKSIKNTQSNTAISVIDTDPNDGILIFNYYLGE